MQANSLARVRGRSIGTLFFSVFGSLWLMLSCFAFHRLARSIELSIVVAALTFMILATALLRAVPRELAYDPQRERDGKQFAWVNVIQGIAIFAAFQITRWLHTADAAFPWAVLIVGLHFFALPRSYRVRSNVLTGAALTAGALICPLLFTGDIMIGAVALWAGITLWCSAAWALGTAAVLYRKWRQAPER